MLHNLWLLLIASLLKEIGHLRNVFYEMGSIVWKQNEVLSDNVIYSVFNTDWSLKHIALGFMGYCIWPQGGGGGDHSLHEHRDRNNILCVMCSWDFCLQKGFTMENKVNI